MCLSMAAEASAASEAEFAAEADASDVAVIDDAEAESPSDNTADVDSEEAASDDVQIDMGADEDANADAVDITDETEPDFDAFSAEGEETENSFEEQDVTACTEDTAVQTLNEVVKDNEASLLYTRWKFENGKWKLHLPECKTPELFNKIQRKSVVGYCRSDAAYRERAGGVQRHTAYEYQLPWQQRGIRKIKGTFVKNKNECPFLILG